MKHRTLKPHEVEALHRSNWRGWATLLLGVLFALLAPVLGACDGSSDPRTLLFEPTTQEAGALPIGVEQGAGFWSLETDTLDEYKGTVKIEFGPPPDHVTPCAVGWVDRSNPCRPVIGLTDEYYDLVAAHEIGHLSGLQHVYDDPDNVMSEFIGRDNTQTTIEQDLQVLALPVWLGACRR